MGDGLDSQPGRVVDALPGLVWTALADGQIDYVNDRWCGFTGRKAATLHGRAWQRAVHSEDLPQLLEGWQSILSSGCPGQLEARLRRFDGEYRRFLFCLSPMADASGQIVGWSGVNVDIDDRYQSALRERASESRFRMIVDGFPAIVSIRSPGGDLEHVNRQFVEYSGSTLETLRDRPWHSTWHPDDRPGARAAWQSSLDTGNPCEFEGRRRRADGVYRWFQMRGLPLHDADGRIVLWYLLQTDIDDRRRAEALLAGETRLLEMMARGHPASNVLEALCRHFESNADGAACSVMLVDRSGTRFELGAAPSLPSAVAAAMMGGPLDTDAGPCAIAVRKNQQVIVEDLAADVHWQAGPWYAVAIAHGLKSCCATPIRSSTEAVLGAFTIYRHKSGPPAPVDFGLIDQVTHIASIAIERERADDALGKARADLARVARVSTMGALTATIAHEINQPLSGIITNAGTCQRMLATDPPDVDGARETARRTIRDGNRAADVIARLRALFIKKDATSESVDLNEAAREVIALTSREFQRRQVIVHESFPEAIPRVNGDRVQLQQVILNLLMNAAEAMSDVGDRPRRLSIGTEREDSDRVRLTVQDSGAGFDLQSADRLFDAFYTTKSGGMGIGLSVSRSIVESHRGRIWAAPNDGPGATFAFSLPCATGTFPLAQDSAPNDSADGAGAS